MTATTPERPSSRSRRRRFSGWGEAAFSLLLSGIALLLLWYGTIWFFGMDDFFAKRPQDVVRFLFQVPDAAANRQDLFQPLGRTILDAGIGFVAGTVIAVVIAASFAVMPALRAALLPLFLALQSVPMLAMIPLIVLIFGRGFVGVAVVTSMVTFFPTLVSLVVAMGRSSNQLRELMTAYNGSRWQILTRLELPTALPALLASLRVAVPRALLGALLAEWLASGEGLGFTMVYATTNANFALLWSSVVTLCVVSLAGYSLMSGLERALLARLGLDS